MILEKFLSRKLAMTLVTNGMALYLAFGGQLTPAQSAALIGAVTSVYIVAQAAQNAVLAIAKAFGKSA